MSTSNELFTPDTVDDQIEQIAGSVPTSQIQRSPDMRLVQHLHYFYETENAEVDATSLARVAERLEYAVSAEGIGGTEEEHDLLAPVAEEHGVFRSFPTKPARRRKLRRALSLIAAVAMLTLLIGSMVAVFTLARNGRSGTVTASNENSAYVFANSTLYKIDIAHQSTIVWSKQIDNVGSYAPAQEQPVSNGIVYVTATTAQADVYAFSAKDGSLLWLVPLHLSTNDSAHSSVLQPVVANGRVYIMSVSGKLFALDAASGAQRWTYELPVATMTAADMTIGAHGMVYASLGNTLVALNGTSGSKVWATSIKANQYIYHSVFNQNTLYLTWNAAPSSPGFPFMSGLYAFDAATGHQRWSDSLHTNGITLPVVAGSKVYVGEQNTDATSSIYVFNTIDGSLAWQHKFDIAVPPQFKSGTYLMSPIVGDEKLYIQAYSSAMISIRGPFIPNIRFEYAFNAATGALLWQHQQPRQDEMVYSFFEQEGTLYMIGYTITRPIGQVVIESLDGKTGRAA